ncbi:MAG: hypothetical protein WCW31_00585 [Patescibacteria group bacterium]
MSDISLLPDPFREKEEELKKSLAEPVKNEPVVSMHVPNKEEEDVEIIEVDENEVDKMLESEPFYSRLYYKLGVWGDEMRKKLFAPREVEPPPKSPPQFFTPTKPKPPTKLEAGSLKLEVGIKKEAPTAAQPIIPVESQLSEAPKPPEVKITPHTANGEKRTAEGGKRVRIIKRVRKPVHVSLLSEELVRDLQINVGKRKFTLAFLTIFLVTIFACAYVVLDRVTQSSNADLAVVTANETQIKTQTSEQQAKWALFQDLEPRLIALNGLLDNHVSVLKLFNFLEQKTLKTVSYGNFVLDSTGKLSLSVVATDLPSTARQLMIFREASEVISVDAGSFAIQNDKEKSSTSFQMIVLFKPDVLRLAASTSTK